MRKYTKDSFKDSSNNFYKLYASLSDSDLYEAYQLQVRLLKEARHNYIKYFRIMKDSYGTQIEAERCLKIRETVECINFILKER